MPARLMIPRHAYFWLAVLFLLGASALAYRNVQELIAQDRSVEHTLTVINTVERLETELSDGDAGLRQYLLTGDEAYLRAHRTAPGEIAETTRTLRNLTADNSTQQQRIAALEPLVASRINALSEVIRIQRSGGSTAERSTAIEHSRAVAEQIQAIITAMTAEESRLYRLRRDEVQVQARIVTALFVAAVLVSLLTIFLVFYRMSAEVRLRREAEKAVRDLNAELESRVQARTNELLDANVKLQGEISERKRVSEAHRETSETLSAVIDASPFAIVALDTERHVMIWNRAAERIFGYRAIEVMGHPYPLVPEDRRDEFDDIFTRAAKGEIVRDLQVVRRRKDGRYLEVGLASAPLYDAGGTWRGVIALLEDVTEQKSTEQQLRHAQKMEAVGQLTGGIAHDFNNLLTVIISNIDLAEDHVAKDSELWTLLEMARNAGLRGAELTKRLLAFARKQPLQPKVIDLNERLPVVAALLIRTLPENIRVSAVAAPDLWPAVADPLQLENALVNLAINSRDAMPRGGELVIETANVRLDEHYAAQNPDVTPGDYVMLAVTDSGTGMSPEVVERAFEPFFTTKPVGQGSGLGLSMVYGFVKQSGGHLKAYSELERGTSIKLYLPRAGTADAREAAAPGAMAEEHPTGHETVLLVEDSPDVRRLAVFMLRQLGYKVLEAENARLALGILSGPEKVDLLFTDIVMPEGTNGYELAQRARELKPGLKVLFTSGYSEGFMRTDASRNGHSTLKLEQLLSKPFRKQELARKVRAALDGTT